MTKRKVNDPNKFCYGPGGEVRYRDTYKLVPDGEIPSSMRGVLQPGKPAVARPSSRQLAAGVLVAAMVYGDTGYHSGD